MLRSASTLALAAAVLFLTSAAAKAQKTLILVGPGPCTDPLIFDEPSAGRFPPVVVFEPSAEGPSDLDIAGNAEEALAAPKDLTTIKNFIIVNGRNESVHVEMLTRDCAFHTQFDLPRKGSYYDTRLIAGVYAVRLSTQGHGGLDFTAYVVRDEISSGNARRTIVAAAFIRHKYFIV